MGMSRFKQPIYLIIIRIYYLVVKNLACLMRLIWTFLLWITGWKIRGQYPYHLKKMVIIVAPHTSAWDFVLGLAVRSKLRLGHVRFLGKKELFDGPFGFFFRWLGGIPVDRSSAHNLVDQVVERFNAADAFSLVLSPEGTRKRVERLKTGFYHIAHRADVPLVMVGFDFGRKEVVIAEPFDTTDNTEADFQKIIQFFGRMKGKNPDWDVKHLL
jgi:1-acyl-sn-glycerol-3-phosphate acyltransferase